MSGATPFLTACYIVKDEEDVLESSLIAVSPFVDEIVVYDTGSSDGTVAIARRFGATVVEGHWDDDFGAARNRALAHCRGPWVLSVDADEQASGDPAAFRAQLRTTSAEQVHVVVHSEQMNSGHGTYQSLAARGFRRSRYRWEGALHEQLVPVGKRRQHTGTEHLRLDHVGYTPLRWQERGKSERNIQLAEAALRRAEDLGVEDLNKFLMDAARSRAAAEHHSEALAHFQRIDRSGARSVVAACAQAAFLSAIAVGDHDAAAGWIDSLASLGMSPVTVHLMHGQLAMARGDLDSALAYFTTLEDGADVYGLPVSASVVAGDLALVHVMRREYDEALAALLPAIAGGHVSPPLNTLLGLAELVPDAHRRIAASLPTSLITEYAAQARLVEPLDADALLEAMYQGGRELLPVLVSAAGIATQLDVERALVWSVRLREAGHGQQCPLVAIMADRARTLDDRIVAGALLVEGGNDTVLPLLEPLLSATGDTESLLARLRALTPGFAAVLVLA